MGIYGNIWEYMGIYGSIWKWIKEGACKEGRRGRESCCGNIFLPVRPILSAVARGIKRFLFLCHEKFIPAILLKYFSEWIAITDGRGFGQPWPGLHHNQMQVAITIVQVPIVDLVQFQCCGQSMTGQALQSASHCRRRSRVVAKSSRVVAKNSRVVASSSRVGGRGRVVARGKILVGRRTQLWWYFWWFFNKQGWVCLSVCLYAYSQGWEGVKKKCIIKWAIREASPFQNGWIFGKVPNGLWPPPSFSENHIADFLKSCTAWKTIHVVYFWKALGTRVSKIMIPAVKYKVSTSNSGVGWAQDF